MGVDGPFVLLDDARPGGRVRLFRDPQMVLVARDAGEVAGVLKAVRAGLEWGLHAAGFLAYGAGAAFEDRAPASPYDPLAWFGLFNCFEAFDPADLPDPRGAWIGAAEPAIDFATYAARIDEVLALIRAGDIYQANLTFPASARVVGHPLAAYGRLRAASGAGWGAVVSTGKAVHLSLSPELFFTAEGGRLIARPMKGTAPRAADPAADRAAAEALAADPKQRAENLMIVDLMRNDLSRVAVPGSVRVPRLFEVEAYPTVHQMTSTVEADLAPGRDAVDVMTALFPCGSITGAPKLRAMQAIAEIERAPRGLYTGAIGHFAPGGDAAFNVAIRTLTLPAGSDRATLGLGSGIVADSVAVAEWDECLAKGAFLTKGARAFDLIETMRFDPREGLVLLERHLERMRASAATFGFPFDRHAVRNELQAATFRLREGARVRLMLSPSGAVAIETGPLPSAGAEPWRVAVVPLPVDPADFRLRHKTSDRRFYDAARDAHDEVVFVDPAGFVTEGSFTSVFVERGGVLLTPPASRGLLPGVLRAELLASGRAIEHDLTPEDLAGGFLLGNALRGLVSAVMVAAHQTTSV
ncbi:aminodeoxychorismate synthase, component I [Sphingomonas spermidinifaciens]|uniref:Probable branched-chain-amino-acid aminotransferase n=1 Tax=Sphingomonas spermidinifaciens TaxID=1141889 RepID=A0A2A4BA71_9SPHN|nr:aminodeoxychorismate synthase component I [Sphingomonas spermidinifaciens]PCD04534.1 aminodeoxychorismate synthase, component I [Sphingomonas spermidinifaciens]